MQGRSQLIVLLTLLVYVAGFNQLKPQHAMTHHAFPTSMRAPRTEISAVTMTSSSSSSSQIKKAVSKILLSAAIFINPASSFARPEGVNRPDLLPKEQTTIIDVANFLTKGQEKKVAGSIADLEKLTGYKLRVLCQSYPNTPGLAIKDYWGVDDNTILMVVDRGEGFNRKGIPTNIINLNIGKNMELVLPSQFWVRLGNKLGNQFYVKENGEDVAVLNAVEAITYCLGNTKNTDPDVKQCADLPFNL